MQTKVILSSELESRNKALGYTFLVVALVMLLLFFAKFTYSPPVKDVAAPVIDSLQIAYIPLRIQKAPETRVAVSQSGGRASAPVARWNPTPREARPTEGPLPGQSKPLITSNEPTAVEEPKIDERGLFKKVDKPANGNNPNAKPGEGGNPNGQPNGSIAGRGGTGGIGLDVSGFRFGRLSVAPDPYDETGQLVFVVKVDSQGRIVSLSVKKTSVSASVVAWYKEQLQRVTLVPTSTGERPEISTGEISLRITAR